MKKIISVIMVMAICLSMAAGLSGCNGSGGSDNKIRWAIMWYEQKDSAAVMQKANELLQKHMPGVELEIVCVEDLAAKFPMWLSSGERYDLVWSGYAFDVGSEINKKAYLPLNDLIEEYAPNLKAEWAAYEGAYNTITFKNELYGIPHMQYYVSETSRFQIPAELRDYFDEDAFLKAAHSSHLATRELFEVVDDYLERSYNAGAWDSDYVASVMGPLLDFCTFVAQRGYDFIGTGENGNYMCYDPFAEEPVITNFMLTEQFKLMMEYASKWYKAGYISKDVMSGMASDGRQGIMTAHTVENWFQVDDERGIKFANESGFDVVRYLMDDADNKYQGAINLGSMASYTCIPVTAKNPELAIQLVDLLHSEAGKELFNLLIYGIEGQHYDKTGENRVEPYDYVTQGSSSSDYGVANWMMGNLDYAWETPNIQDGQAAYVKNYNTNVVKGQHKSPLYSFCVDTEPVTSELNQITAIFKEYKAALVNGVMDDYMAYYNTMIDKAKAAGLDKAIAEFQSQADAFLESK